MTKTKAIGCRRFPCETIVDLENIIGLLMVIIDNIDKRDNLFRDWEHNVYGGHVIDCLLRIDKLKSKRRDYE